MAILAHRGRQPVFGSNLYVDPAVLVIGLKPAETAHIPVMVAHYVELKRDYEP